MISKSYKSNKLYILSNIDINMNNIESNQKEKQKLNLETMINYDFFSHQKHLEIYVNHVNYEYCKTT